MIAVICGAVLGVTVCHAEVALAGTEENKALVRSLVDAGNSRDYERLDDLVSEHFVRHCQATPELDIRTRDQFKEYMRKDASVFPDARVTIQHIIAEGDFVAIWAEYSGTQEGQMGPFSPSHKRMTIDFGAIFRVESARLAELWVTWDNLAALTQLGHSPPPKEEAR
jgi:predicted ester cyclase